MLNGQVLPEYPHRLTAHLNSPTTINISGRISHCDNPPRAGQRNAARGNAGLGLGVLAFTTRSKVALGEPWESNLRFLRGRREGVGGREEGMSDNC